MKNQTQKRKSRSYFESEVAPTLAFVPIYPSISPKYYFFSASELLRTAASKATCFAVPSSRREGRKGCLQ